MKYRKLRIACSVGCAALCFLLAAFWVRSMFFACDGIWLRIPDRWVFAANSRHGGVGFGLSTREQVNDLQLQVFISPPNHAPDIEYVTALGVGICWSPIKGHYFLRIPDWLLILSMGTAAVVLLRGTTLRFSLRTLLIATTLAGVILGFAVYLSK